MWKIEFYSISRKRLTVWIADDIQSFFSFPLPSYLRYGGYGLLTYIPTKLIPSAETDWADRPSIQFLFFSLPLQMTCQIVDKSSQAGQHKPQSLKSTANAAYVSTFLTQLKFLENKDPLSPLSPPFALILTAVCTLKYSTREIDVCDWNVCIPESVFPSL